MPNMSFSLIISEYAPHYKRGVHRRYNACERMLPVQGKRIGQGAALRKLMMRAVRCRACNLCHACSLVSCMQSRVTHTISCYAHNLLSHTQFHVTHASLCHVHNPMSRIQSHVMYAIPCHARNPSHARSAASPRSSRSYSCARYSESSCGMSGLCVSPRSQHSMKCCAS